MVSLLTWVGLLVALLLILPWAVGRAARAIGSPRGTYGVGAKAILLVFVINSTLAFLMSKLAADTTHPAIQAIFLLCVSIGIEFAVFSSMFRLSLVRTFAPAGAYFLLSLAVAGLAFGILRPFVSESFIMPTRSMMPTINVDDRFFADKLPQPRRFDLVVYWNTFNGERARYVKRLVGLPGERLRFDGGGIFINDQPVAVPAVLAGRCRAYLPSMSPDSRRYEDGQTITLGNSEYFLVGDNVDISGDSRINGPSDRSSLIGVVDWIYWPLGRFRIVR